MPVSLSSHQIGCALFSELRQTKRTRVLSRDFTMAVVGGRNTVKRKVGGDNQYYEETEGMDEEREW